MSSRWVRDSSNAAHVALVQLFKEGAIEPTTAAKLIYDSNEIFQKFSIAVFRNVFNELKSQYGVLCK